MRNEKVPAPGRKGRVGSGKETGRGKLGKTKKRTRDKGKRVIEHVHLRIGFICAKVHRTMEPDTKPRKERRTRFRAMLRWETKQRGAKNPMARPSRLKGCHPLKESMEYLQNWMSSGKQIRYIKSSQKGNLRLRKCTHWRTDASKTFEFVGGEKTESH